MAIGIGQTGTSTATGLGFTAVAGRLLVAVMGIRDSEIATGINGWTALIHADAGETAVIFYKIAAGGETTVDATYAPPNGVNKGVVAAEFTGMGPVLTIPPSGLGLTAGGSGGANDACPAMTPNAGAECLIVGGVASLGFDSGYTVAGGGFTFLGSVVAGAADNPVIGACYRIIGAAAGAYTPSVGVRNQTHASVSGLFYPGSRVPAMVGEPGGAVW